MTPETPSARELIRRLVAREAVRGDAPDSAVAAVHAACERVCAELTRWLGANGCHALFTRAVAQARAEHPFLGEIHLGTRSEPRLDGVREIVEAHGPTAVAAGLESLLVALLELLGRLIGDDMATRLVERNLPNHPRNDESLR